MTFDDENDNQLSEREVGGRTGDSIGRYQLLRLLGQGASGSVYLARADSEAANEVAIKRLHSFAGPDERERLRREASTLSDLRHPHVLAMLDVIDDDALEGVALVLEHAPGGTLAERLRNSGTLPSATVVELLGPVADALAYAHSRGVVHRDVKPSNVLFAADGRPVLSDFGIARNAAQTNLTRTDLAIGTAAYLDPDVADGATPSAASDQYALGIVAYEALVGTPPFNATTPLGVLKAADRGEFATLDRRVIDPVVADAVERAIARQPSQRWSSMEAFASALRGVALDDAPIDATTTFRRRATTTAIEQATPVKRSRRRQWIAVGSVVALLGAAGAAAAVRASSDRGLQRLPVPALPSCAPQTDAQCVQSYSRTATGVRVDFGGGEQAEYRFGSSNDAIRVANFFCGGRATAALYRPSDGFVYYLSNWPDPRSDETSAVAVDATGIIGGVASVGDFDGNDCADLALDVDGMRTWFLPSEQSGRLQPGELVVTSRTAS